MVRPRVTSTGAGRLLFLEVNAAMTGTAASERNAWASALESAASAPGLEAYRPKPLPKREVVPGPPPVGLTPSGYERGERGGDRGGYDRGERGGFERGSTRTGGRRGNGETSQDAVAGGDWGATTETSAGGWGKSTGTAAADGGWGADVTTASGGRGEWGQKSTKPAATSDWGADSTKTEAATAEPASATGMDWQATSETPLLPSRISPRQATRVVPIALGEPMQMLARDGAKPRPTTYGVGAAGITQPHSLNRPRAAVAARVQSARKAQPNPRLPRPVVHLRPSQPMSVKLCPRPSRRHRLQSPMPTRGQLAVQGMQTRGAQVPVVGNGVNPLLLLLRPPLLQLWP
ncbi:hypothetical protein BCR44DRAFT_1049200 [Catenaria anguillulae PL171]|uniref:Uncharacterized protein n=1 Tax=Catenaria anguillulae PL171 TaxID=765915 RepID=A0A1Y2HQQ0_9FUNG|nr:hypothetical protein BCR44DRAFT_1049200 [Catenaria anguillulae PL171]